MTVETSALKLARGEGELSRTLDVTHLEPGRRYELVLEASPEECTRLATRFRVEAIDNIHVDMTVMRSAKKEPILVTGQLRARVSQVCIVTLEPFSAPLKADFYFECQDEHILRRSEDPEDEVVEPIVHNKVDLGEVVAQLFALEIDPYPRSPAAQALENGENPPLAPKEQEKRQKPFENLANLLKKESE